MRSSIMTVSLLSSMLSVFGSTSLKVHVSLDLSYLPSEVNLLSYFLDSLTFLISGLISGFFDILKNY